MVSLIKSLNNKQRCTPLKKKKVIHSCIYLYVYIIYKSNYIGFVSLFFLLVIIHTHSF